MRKLFLLFFLFNSSAFAQSFVRILDGKAYKIYYFESWPVTQKLNEHISMEYAVDKTGTLHFFFCGGQVGILPNGKIVVTENTYFILSKDLEIQGKAVFASELQCESIKKRVFSAWNAPVELVTEDGNSILSVTTFH